MAPLFANNLQFPSTGEDAPSNVELKLTADVAEKTLTLIDEVLDSFEDVAPVKAAESRRLLPQRLCRNLGMPMLVGIIFLVTAFAVGVLLIQDLDSVVDCEDTYTNCCLKVFSPDRTATAASGSDCCYRREREGAVDGLSLCSNGTMDFDVELECESDDVVQLQKGGYTSTLRRACRIERMTVWEGMSAWRWLLFATLFWPLALVGHVLSRLLAALVSANVLHGNAVFLTFGLHIQFAYVIRAALWMASWFIIANEPLDWARRSSKWNELADGESIWNDAFEEVHDVVWRILLAFLLYTLIGLISSAAGKLLSLQFHHRNHFERMEKALVHEHIIQLFSKPQRLVEHAVVKANGEKIILKGYNSAHWAALTFVSDMLKEGSALQQLENCKDTELSRLRHRAAALQVRLAQLLSEKVATLAPAVPLDPSGMTPQFTDSSAPAPFTPSGEDDSSLLYSISGRNRWQGSSLRHYASNPASVPTESANIPSAGATGEIPAADTVAMPQVLRSRAASAFDESAHTSKISGSAGPNMTVDDILQAVHTRNQEATRASRWDAIRINLGNVKCSGNDRSRRLGSESIKNRQRKRDENLPSDTAHAIAHLIPPDGKKDVRAKKQTTHDSKNIALLSERLASAKVVASEPANRTVNQLQTYLLGNSYIKVFSLDGEGDKDSKGKHGQHDVKNRLGARQLGYYLFWNLRATNAGFALTEAEVHSTAEKAGLQHKDSAWSLFDRNGDSCATLAEVIESVEDVYTNRKTLTRTLLDSQSVVAQVEKLIWVALFVVFAFAVLAIFDPSSLRSTWTALSAGLLSFSFIFGNSIRQVFENAVWLFFSHGFDVGDVIQYLSDRYTVRSVNLNYINVERVDGADVNIPTDLMRSAAIHNVTRSNKLWQNIKQPIDNDTPLEALEAVAEEVVACIKLHPNLYGGSYRIWFEEAQPTLKMQMAVYYNANTNGLDLLLLGQARTYMNDAVARGVNRFGVNYTLPPSKGGHVADSALKAGLVDATLAGEGQASQEEDPTDNEVTRTAAAAHMFLLS